MAEVKIVGLHELEARLAEIGRSFDVETEKALKEVTTKIRDKAKELCPVDTGSLKKSIRRTAYAREKGHIHQMGVRAGGYVTNPRTGRKVDYASYVEYGTSRTPAQPYLRPAVEAHKRELIKAVKRGLQR